jgi:hypothetical protein
MEQGQCTGFGAKDAWGEGFGGLCPSKGQKSQWTRQHYQKRSTRRNSALGIATGWTAEGSEFESRYGQEFSLLHIVQTGSGVHPTSYRMDTGGSFPGRKADHSPTSAEVKKTWVYTSTPPYAFMA